jgi:hypothetical protein
MRADDRDDRRRLLWDRASDAVERRQVCDVSVMARAELSRLLGGGPRRRERLITTGRCWSMSWAARSISCFFARRRALHNSVAGDCKNDGNETRGLIPYELGGTFDYVSRSGQGPLQIVRRPPLRP